MLEVVKVSASQLSLFETCMRKWAFKYIEGLGESETFQLALGLRVHAILEDYLRDGTPPNRDETWTYPDHDGTYFPGRIALSMMPADSFPLPGTGHVEHGFEFTVNGVLWNGKLDWHLIGATRVWLTDHKTSVDPAKWGLTDETMPLDTQARIYAAAFASLGLPITARWNYGARDASPRKARVAQHTFDPREAWAYFMENIQPIGEEIRRLRLAKVDPLSLEANANNCHRYNKPCPHIERCNLTNKERMKSLMGTNSRVAELLAKSKARRGIVNPPESSIAPPVVAAVPDPDPEPAPDKAAEPAKAQAETIEEVGRAVIPDSMLKPEHRQTTVQPTGKSKLVEAATEALAEAAAETRPAFGRPPTAEELARATVVELIRVLSKGLA